MKYMRSEGSTELKISVLVFWVVMPHEFVDSNISNVSSPSSGLKMTAVILVLTILNS
jgi:hypothetical protein